MQKYIVHVDMDAFFAAVEQRDNRALRNKPVIIGADPKKGKGRGVVSTCSYEARQFGVHSAMPISIAYKKCPQAVFLKPNIKKYSLISREIFEIFYNFTPKIEVVSIDEAFLDITGSFHLFGKPSETCFQIKDKIKKQTGLTASIGLAPTKMVAKIASDLSKPDGFIEVNEEEVTDFLWPLDIGKIWGLGSKSKAILNNRGIITIGDLANTNPEITEDIFGKNGLSLWLLANGRDEREVEDSPEAKSIGNEFTFDADTDDKKAINRVIMNLCEKVSDRLRKEGFKGRTITLKIRLQGFTTYNRSISLVRSTNFVDIIYKTIKKLFDRFDLKNRKVRLLGVKVSNLIDKDTKDFLFIDKLDERNERLHRVKEELTRKYGGQIIHRAANL